MIYTVTCNPAVDYVVRCAEPQSALNLGTVNRLSGEEIYFGGKGVNVSLMLNTLGIPSTALGFIAGFTGAAIEQGVRAAGVQTDFIHLEQGFSRINVKIKSSEETELNGAGPAIPPEAADALFDKLSALAVGDTVVLAGSIPASLPQNFYEQILTRLPDGVRAVVDASGELLLRVLPYQPFLIKPNHHELEELFQVNLTGADKEQIAVYARKLQEMGAKNVLVSMAGDGAVLVTDVGTVYVCGACSGKLLNSVGAGDSMVAGFLAGYEKTRDYGYALRLGTAAGGATAFSDGLGTKEQIDDLLTR